MSVNLQNFSVTSGAAAQVNVPTYTITAQVYDATTNALIADFTGANALKFPAVMGTLTAAQVATLVNKLANDIILMKAGLE